MRIARIDLQAWGHFSGRCLDLPASSGLQLICGANEAGKSTLRRALSGALFGIPMRCSDAHRHDYAALRIGLLLEGVAGQRLALMRRKGQQNTLRGYDVASGLETDERLADTLLGAWLGGLSDEHFSQRFSLDHDALLRGGEALAAGRGDAGESLFQAGSGLTSIHKLRQQLQAEAEALFRPRARSTQILQTQKALEDAEQQAHSRSVRPQAWLAAEADCAASQAALAALRLEQQQGQADIQRLQRLAGAFPDLALRQQLQAELTQLAEQTPLAILQRWTPSQRETRLTALARREAAQQQLRQINERRSQRQASLTALQTHAADLPDQALLAEAASIAALHHQAASHRDLGRALQTASQALAQADAELARCASVLPATLQLPDAVQLARLRSLAQERIAYAEKQAATAQALNSASLEVRQLQEAAAALAARLPAANSPLRRADFVPGLTEAGNPEAQAAQLQARLPALSTRLAQQLATLQLADAAALKAVTLPLDSELESAARDQASRLRQHDELQQRRTSLLDEMAGLEQQLQQLSLRGNVPSRASLAHARQQREQLWQQVRPDARPAPATALCPSYEAAVHAADQVADALYQDAERATHHAALSARLTQLRTAHAKVEADLLAWADTDRQQQADWQQLCARHHWPALAPAAAKEWRQHYLEARALADELAQTRTEVGVCAEKARALRARLAEVLPELNAAEKPGENHATPLAEWLGRAQQVARQASEHLQQARWLAEQQQAKEASRQQRAAEAAALAEQQQHWQADWAAALAQIGLDATATAAEMEVRLAQCDALREARATHARAEQQWQHSDRQHRAYRDALAALCATLAAQPGCADLAARLDKLATDAIAETLWQALEAARQTASRRTQLQAALEEDQLAAAQADSELRATEATLAELQAAADCPDLDTLEQREADSARHHELQAQRRAAEQRLVQQAAQPLDALLRSTAGMTLESVEARLEAAKTALQLSNQALETALTAANAAEQRLAAIDGSTAAAEFQQTASNLRARLETQIATYRSTRLASAILEQVIAHYQQRHQDPLLARASAHYAAITGGRFARIVVDTEETRQVLLAERPGGERLPVTALSTGRRDQLYLALRLAAMAGDNAARRANGGEPLPLVFDDVLIQFDDDAAAATFRILAELAPADHSGMVPQILYLTHHPHLAEVARAALGQTPLAVHTL